MSTVEQSSERLGPSAIRTDLPALLFPGQGSETPDMRAVVERERPDLLRLAIEVVGADPFSIHAAGVRSFVEVGPGRVLTAFVRRIVAEASAH